MPGSSHHGLSPKASFDPSKSQHPDLDEYGNVRWETNIDPDRRAFLEVWADPVKKAAFMDGVAARQAREHEDVQRYVGGLEYPGPDPLAAFQQYQADLQSAREIYGHEREFTSYDIANMSLEQFDAAFDQNGRPREGYSFRQTDRDVRPDSQAVDRFSRQENLSRASDPR